MKRFVAFLLMIILVLSGCAAPTEEEFAPNDAPVIEVQPDEETSVETPDELPDKLPSEESDASVETPVPETTPEEPVEDSNEAPVETPVPDTTTEEPAEDEETSEYADYTTTCMTFNVLERNTGGSTAYALPNVRAPWVLSTILKYEADLVGLQEVTKGNTTSENYDMYTYLTKALKEKGYDCSGLMDSKGKAGCNVAINDYTIGSGLLILWKRDRFELRDFGAQAYSNDSGRHFQWVKLYDKKEDITILMTNTHMSINPKTDSAANNAKAGDAIRAQQANELYQFWYGNCKKGMALYATGDFNHKTDSPAFANLTKGQFVSTNYVSQHSDASSGIDHVFINGDIQDCFEYHRCTDTFEPKGQTPTSKHRASDHYAIVTYCSNAYR